MSIPNTATLRSIISLAEKRESLLSELSKVEAQLESAMRSGAAPAARGRAPKAAKVKAPRKKRGAIKELILSALHTAGEAGVAVKDLAAKLGLKNQNVHVWFNTTGKKAGIKKVSPGVYALTKSAPAAPAKAEAAPAKKAVVKKATGKKATVKKGRKAAKKAAK